MSFVPIKFIQVRLSLRINHGSGRLWNIVHSVQSASIYDVDATPAVDQDDEHSAVADMHGDDESVIVQKVNRAGICLLEHDWLARG